MKLATQLDTSVLNARNYDNENAKYTFACKIQIQVEGLLVLYYFSISWIFEGQCSCNPFGPTFRWSVAWCLSYLKVNNLHFKLPSDDPIYICNRILEVNDQTSLNALKSKWQNVIMWHDTCKNSITSGSVCFGEVTTKTNIPNFIKGFQKCAATLLEMLWICSGECMLFRFVFKNMKSPSNELKRQKNNEILELFGYKSE